MRIKSRRYPHPVLSYFTTDFVECGFQTTLRITATKSDYLLDVECRVSDADLLQLIEDGSAEYAIHVECPSTYFRELFRSAQTAFRATIRSDDLNGQVEICAVIIATRDIDGYHSQNFDFDYHGVRFEVRKGDVLAVDRDRSFEVEKPVDPLRKVTSIFSVVPVPGDDAPTLDIDTMGNRIIIKLDQESFDHYRALARDQSLHPILSSAVVMPALVWVLAMMRHGDISEEEQDLRWYRVISNRLRDIGVSFEGVDASSESPVAVAQRLIGDPARASLQVLSDYDAEE